MAEVDNREASGTRGRLVLGFDAGCATCSDLARRIGEQVGDKLEIRNLGDPQVREWRRRALGNDAPWAPTLIEVGDARVRAWTGPMLGIQLGRFLGLVATWRVMQVLGEVGQAVRAEDTSLAANVIGGVTRSQFLKGVGGAAVAISVLSSPFWFASRADAEERITSIKILDKDDLVDEAQRAARKDDVINVMGPRLAERIEDGTATRRCREKPDSNGRKLCQTWICYDKRAGCDSRWEGRRGWYRTAPGSTAIKGAIHRFEDGNERLAIVFEMSDGTVYHYYEYDEPAGLDGRTKTEAGRWVQKTSSTDYRRTHVSHNGYINKPVPTRAQTESGRSDGRDKPQLTPMEESTSRETATAQRSDSVGALQYDNGDPCGGCPSAGLPLGAQYYYGEYLTVVPDYECAAIAGLCGASAPTTVYPLCQIALSEFGPASPAAATVCVLVLCIGGGASRCIETAEDCLAC